MSKDTFTWHPDQDDVYDGAMYGSTPLRGPFSAFDKIKGKSFTMNGDDDDTLTLLPTPGSEAFWGAPGIGDLDVTRISINGGTLALKPPHGGSLMLGVGAGPEEQTIINIKGNFLVRQADVTGNTKSGFAQGTFNILEGGRCSIAEGPYFSGSFAINIHDLGSMRVSADGVDINDGNYLAIGIADGDNPSLELIASPSLARPGSGYLQMIRHEIVCKSASVSRLRAKAMSLTDTTMRATDTASLLIACDFIDFAGHTEFVVGQGSAAITFSGSAKKEAPFNIIENDYPKGLFNFITNEGANNSTFRFLNIGSAFEFNKLQATGVITIDGAPVTQNRCGYTFETDGSDKYFVIFLKS